MAGALQVDDLRLVVDCRPERLVVSGWSEDDLLRRVLGDPEVECAHPDVGVEIDARRFRVDHAIHGLTEHRQSVLRGSAVGKRTPPETPGDETFHDDAR